MKEAIVYFIGSGPGNPDLLTVKAAKILSQAEVVVVDRLVGSEILQHYVSSDTTIIPVGKQGHCHGSVRQSVINELLVSLSKKHSCIVRLKGGDTAFFSNILDELETLSQHRIAYEIIPGITTASGASAFTGVPLTARGISSGVNILSCCSLHKMSDEEWKVLALMNNTLVWYMATKEWPKLAHKLIDAGADLKTPLLVVEQATTSKQFVHQFLLENFLSQETELGFVSPSIIIVGKVAGLYDQFCWYRNQSDRSHYFQLLEVKE